MTEKDFRKLEMHVAIEKKLLELEEIIQKDFGFSSMTKFVYMARDPQNEEMSILLMDDDPVEAQRMLAKLAAIPKETYGGLL